MSLFLNPELSKKIIKTGEEYETGRIIDGKKEYAKIIDIGNLPSTIGNTEYPTGLDHSSVRFTDVKLLVFRPSDNSLLYAPYNPGFSPNGPWIISFPGGSNALRININGDNDRSAYIGQLTVSYLYI